MNKAKIFIESNSVRLSEHSGDYEAISKHNALKALEIQEKEYTWHDLAARPDDLPGHREIVVVKIKFDMYHYAIATYSQIDGMWYLREDDEFYQTNKEIIKWQKINE
nr:MAG TPA: hypothetical protein [Caudoviricetes sp.]